MNKQFFTKSGAKEFAKLPDKEQQHVQDRLAKLMLPLPRSLDIKPLKGATGFFRLRVGSIRVIFEANIKEKFIVIRSVGYRGSIYRKV